MNLPNIRIARITKLTKYNTTNSASDVVWGWKPVITEELQVLNENNEWVAIPKVDIYDDSEKQAEEKAKINQRSQYLSKTYSLLEILNSVQSIDTYWHKVDDDFNFPYFLDFNRAQFDFNPAEDGFFYYHSNKGAIAKVKNNEQYIRGDVLRDFLNFKF